MGMQNWGDHFYMIHESSVKKVCEKELAAFVTALDSIYPESIDRRDIVKHVLVEPDEDESLDFKSEYLGDQAHALESAYNELSNTFEELTGLGLYLLVPDTDWETDGSFSQYDDYVWTITNAYVPAPGVQVLRDKYQTEIVTATYTTFG